MTIADDGKAYRYLIETERLRLREFVLDDKYFVVELLNSPGWLQFIGDRHVHTPDDAISYLANGPHKSYATNGYGLWLVEHKEDMQSIGMCGILKRPSLTCPDIGFAFLTEFGGNGYAIESVLATLAYGRENLNIPVMAGIVLPDNARSIRLLEKAGLHLVGPFGFADGPQELLLYRN